jgi:hypothetical protein
MDADEKFLSRSDLVKGHVDALLTVATAVLVLSITILKEANITDPKSRSLLEYSWVLFTASIVAGILHNYTLMHLVKRDRCWPDEADCWHRTILTLFMAGLHLSFLVAVGLFLIFALTNIK